MDTHYYQMVLVYLVLQTEFCFSTLVKCTLVPTVQMQKQGLILMSTIFKTSIFLLLVGTIVLYNSAKQTIEDEQKLLLQDNVITVEELPSLQ